MIKMSLNPEEWLPAEKQDAPDTLIDLLKTVLHYENDLNEIQQEAQTLKSLVEDRLSGQEWRTLVSQMAETLAVPAWKEGIDLLERLMDWKEVNELLTNADSYFDLGFKLERGRLYLPVDGKKTELKRGNFKVLRPLRQEKKKLGKNLTGLNVVDGSMLAEVDNG